MQNETVSVLIPAYNAATFLAQTLDSVLCQTWPHLEVIVVDDGSSDDTLAVAQRYAGPRVRVVTQPNAGASAARNHAFSFATGAYIQYLDADDLLHPDKIRAQMACLQEHPVTVLSSSAWAMFYTQPDEQDLIPTVLWRDYSEPTQWLVDAWENAAWMQPSAWLAHRSLIEAAGPWNEKLTLHDDGEFFSRVVLASSGIVFCGEAKSFYRKGLSDSLSTIRSAKAVRSHLRVCELYEQHLLAHRADETTRRACANNFQSLVYEYYPHYPDVLREAEDRIKALGGSSVQPRISPMFSKMSRLLGWKLSKRIQNFVYQYKLNPAAWRIA